MHMKRSDRKVSGKKGYCWFPRRRKRHQLSPHSKRKSACHHPHQLSERARGQCVLGAKPVKHFLLPNEDPRSPGFFSQGSQAYLSSMPISCNGGGCFLTAFLMLQFSQDFSSLWHRIAQKNRILGPRRNSQWLRKKVVISIGRWTTKREKQSG